MFVKKAVIPAAGFGTRMLPASKTVPKELLPILKKPSIQYVIEEAAASGCSDILIISSQWKSSLEEYFSPFPELEDALRKSGRNAELYTLENIHKMANVSFVYQPKMRGLGDAIYYAREFTGDAPFAVLLPDDIMLSETPVTEQLINTFGKFDAPSVGVKYIDDNNIGRYCTLDVEKQTDNVYKVHSLIEKPRKDQIMSNFAVLGRYVITSDIYEIIKNLSPGFGGEIQLTDALDVLAKRGELFAVDFEGMRYDAGNIKGYLETIVDFALHDADIGEWFKELIRDKTI